MTPAPCPECGETAGHLPACRAPYAVLLDECDALRRQLAEAQGESLAYQAQLDAAREALPPDLLAANDGYVHEAIAHLWRGFSTERGTLDGVLDELAALRARVVELEALHDNAADLFASGRRYERALAGLLVERAEDRAAACDAVCFRQAARIAELEAVVKRERARAYSYDATVADIAAELRKVSP